MWTSLWPLLWVFHCVSCATMVPAIDTTTNAPSITETSTFLDYGLDSFSTAAPDSTTSGPPTTTLIPTDPITGTNTPSKETTTSPPPSTTTTVSSYENVTIPVDGIVESSTETTNMTDALAKLSNAVRERIASAGNASASENISVATITSTTSPNNVTEISANATVIEVITVQTNLSLDNATTLIELPSNTSSVNQTTTSSAETRALTNTTVDSMNTTAALSAGVASNPESAPVAVDTIMVSEAVHETAPIQIKHLPGSFMQTGTIMNVVPMVKAAPAVSGVAMETVPSAVLAPIAPLPDMIVETVPVASGVQAPLANLIVNAIPQTSGVFMEPLPPSNEVIVETVPVSSVTRLQSLSRLSGLARGIAGTGGRVSSAIAGRRSSMSASMSPAYSMGMYLCFVLYYTCI